MYNTQFTARLDVFSISTKKHLRNCGTGGELYCLGSGEYFSFTLYIHNDSPQPYTWEDAFVRIDGGQPLRWPKGQVKSQAKGVLRISPNKMAAYTTPGDHEAVWYFDGKPVLRQCFHLTAGMNWQQVFSFPTRQQIAAASHPHRSRSPYLCGWLEIPETIRYHEYTVDFQADHLPSGTYCCLGNWKMDTSGLQKQYRQIRTWAQGVHAYAGFQRLADGSTTAILSFWDLNCTDYRGNTVMRSATRIYPPTVLNGNRFGGEGEGERSNVPFFWQANRWYRMHLKCNPAGESTMVEQWVQDLQTGESTFLSCFSFPVPNSAMQGNIAVFLENFQPETAGEVRSMEVRNARYRNAATGKWQTVRKVCIAPNGGLPDYEGSYNFGVTNKHIWMITSGAGGDWYGNGKGKQATWFSIV